MRRQVLSWVVCGIGLAAGGFALEPVNQTLLGGLAIDGYDAVAYFAESRAVAGSAALTVEWNGAVWRFASEEHRSLFAAEPEKFAPRYGGYCAWAVAHGYTADADPEAWAIVDGRLYLNYNRSVQEKWSQARAEMIARADENWPGLLAAD